MDKPNNDSNGDEETVCLLSILQIIEGYRDIIEGQSYLSPSENSKIRRKAKMNLIGLLAGYAWIKFIPDYYHEAFKSTLIDLLEKV